MNICVAGKNNIAVEALEYLLTNFPNHNYYACCNSSDSGKNGFQRSFRLFCTQKEVKILGLSDIEKLEDLLFISLEYDKLVKPSNFITERLYNIHFSLLPAYKGMFTSALPIMYGEKYSGVTLHEIDAGIDTGRIIDQIKFEIPIAFSGEDLYKEYIKNSFVLFKKNISKLISGQYESLEQGVIGSSYYSKKTIDYSNLLINYHKTSFEILNQIRAFSFPSYQLPNYKDFRIYAAKLTTDRSVAKPGELLDENEFSILVATVDFNIILLKDRRIELFEACKSGDLEVLKTFLRNDYCLQHRSKEGWDILIIAAFNGHLEIIRFLIERLAWDVNTANNNGTTFLMYVMTMCSLSKQTVNLEYALSLPAIDIFKKDFYGNDIFHYAEKYAYQPVINLLNNTYITND